MLADGLDELHEFGQRIGMRRAWFQEPPKASRPHYDLNESRRAVAVRYGAIEIDRRQTVELSRALLLKWQQQRDGSQRLQVTMATQVTRVAKVTPAAQLQLL